MRARGVGKALDAFKSVLHEERAEIVRLRLQLKRYQGGAMKRQFQRALQASIEKRRELAEKLNEAMAENDRLKEECQRLAGEWQGQWEKLNAENARLTAEVKRLTTEPIRVLVAQGIERGTAALASENARLTEAVRSLLPFAFTFFDARPGGVVPKERRPMVQCRACDTSSPQGPPGTEKHLPSCFVGKVLASDNSAFCQLSPAPGASPDDATPAHRDESRWRDG